MRDASHYVVCGPQKLVTSSCLLTGERQAGGTLGKSHIYFGPKLVCLNPLFLYQEIPQQGNSPPSNYLWRLITVDCLLDVSLH